jgi:hypothetical protein
VRSARCALHACDSSARVPSARTARAALPPPQDPASAARAHDVMAIRCRGPDTALNYAPDTYRELLPLLLPLGRRAPLHRVGSCLEGMALCWVRGLCGGKGRRGEGDAGCACAAAHAAPAWRSAASGEGALPES